MKYTYIYIERENLFFSVLGFFLSQVLPAFFCKYLACTHSHPPVTGQEKSTLKRQWQTQRRKKRIIRKASSLLLLFQESWKNTTQEIHLTHSEKQHLSQHWVNPPHTAETSEKNKIISTVLTHLSARFELVYAHLLWPHPQKENTIVSNHSMYKHTTHLDSKTYLQFIYRHFIRK